MADDDRDDTEEGGGQLPPRFQRSSRVVQELTTAMAALRNAVSEGSWGTASERAARCLGLGLGAVRTLQHDQATASARAGELDADRERLVNRLHALARADEREAIIAHLREQLSEENPELLERLAPSLDRLAAGETSMVPILQRLEQTERSTLRVGRSPREDVAIAAITRGLLGLAHAEFNGAYEALVGAELPVSERFVEDVAQGLEGHAQELRARQVALFSAFAGSQSPAEARRVAHDLSRWSEETVPVFAATQARVVLAAGSLRQAGRGGASERVGAVAARAGHVLREAVASCAAAHRIGVELGGVSSAAVDRLARSARSTAFDVAIPDGRNTELAKLADSAEGAFVEIAGFVTNFDVGKSSDDKLITRVELLDPSSDARATAAAVFLHLPHVGVTTGAYCQISGLYKSASSLAGGDPAVEIDRLSLSELAAKSWRVGFLRLAEPWFSVWRNSANLRWSLGPHRATEDDALVAEGAGELIYPPFVRNDD